MDYKLHPIGEIDPALLPPLARLHQSALPILLSDMGYPFVLRYFEIAIKDPSVIGFYALSESDMLIGYVIGSPQPGRITSQLTKPLSWFLGQCLGLLFKRPRVLWQALVSSLTVSEQWGSETGAIEVSYMSVDPQARGRGLGRALMTAFHDASRAAGYQRVMGSQEVDNDVSIGLLTDLGYKVKYTFREGHYHRQRIELLL
jgi:ribosomal protein S18 acetylase RimI-like enzyme